MKHFGKTFVERLGSMRVLTANRWNCPFHKLVPYSYHVVGFTRRNLMVSRVSKGRKQIPWSEHHGEEKPTRQ